MSRRLWKIKTAHIENRIRESISGQLHQAPLAVKSIVGSHRPVKIAHSSRVHIIGAAATTANQKTAEQRAGLNSVSSQVDVVSGNPDQTRFTRCQWSGTGDIGRRNEEKRLTCNRALIQEGVHRQANVAAGILKSKPRISRYVCPG